APQTQPAKIDKPATVDYRERYGVLTDRNMFLRDRRGPRSRWGDGPSSRPSYDARPIDETLILTGIVFEEGEWRAYFEDTRASSALRLRVGESVGRGVISQIQMDAILYLNGDQQIWIDVGRTLTGAIPPAPPVRFVEGPSRTAPSSTTQPGTAATDTQPGTAATETTSTTTAATPATATPLPNPDDPNLTLEERMKLRRAQQLNR
ncbi:MAG: hypothetical protein ACHRXM_40725, partial [Isosphaerales bacterium]